MTIITRILTAKQTNHNPEAKRVKSYQQCKTARIKDAEKTKTRLWNTVDTTDSELAVYQGR
jgi:hypothetical protein